MKISQGNGWAMQSPSMTFGWAANPMSGIAKESITEPVAEDGDCDLYLYRTWRGEYMPAISVTSSGGAGRQNSVGAGGAVRPEHQRRCGVQANEEWCGDRVAVAAAPQAVSSERPQAPAAQSKARSGK